MKKTFDELSADLSQKFGGTKRQVREAFSDARDGKNAKLAAMGVSVTSLARNKVRLTFQGKTSAAVLCWPADMIEALALLAGTPILKQPQP